jgi:hypothetical protein
MWHLGEHQRPSQDVQFDHLVVVDPNVRNVIAAKAPAMSWLSRYMPPNSAAVSTAPAKTHLHLHRTDDQVPRDGGTQPGSKLGTPVNSCGGATVMAYYPRQSVRRCRQC